MPITLSRSWRPTRDIGRSCSPSPCTPGPGSPCHQAGTRTLGTRGQTFPCGRHNSGCRSHLRRSWCLAAPRGCGGGWRARGRAAMGDAELIARPGAAGWGLKCGFRAAEALEPRGEAQSGWKMRWQRQKAHHAASTPCCASIARFRLPSGPRLCCAVDLELTGRHRSPAAPHGCTSACSLGPSEPIETSG